jgi:hypothetical protein
MKYFNKPPIVPGQEREIFPIIDAALQLPYGKAIAYQCTKTRANYLYRIIQGERYRNAVESIATYTPDDYLYGRGLYYHLVPEVRSKGLILANVESPPNTVTWDIIRCAATKKPVEITVPVSTAQSRLNQLKVKFPNELGIIYIKDNQLCYAIPSPEELIVVDIDIGSKVLPPTNEQRAKLRQ